jgi:hypothetical protein
MAYVLAMAAFEMRDPVARRVAMERHDLALHGGIVSSLL